MADLIDSGGPRATEPTESLASWAELVEATPDIRRGSTGSAARIAGRMLNDVGRIRSVYGDSMLAATTGSRARALHDELYETERNALAGQRHAVAALAATLADDEPQLRSIVSATFTDVGRAAEALRRACRTVEQLDPGGLARLARSDPGSVAATPVDEAGPGSRPARPRPDLPPAPTGPSGATPSTTGETALPFTWGGGEIRPHDAEQAESTAAAGDQVTTGEIENEPVAPEPDPRTEPVAPRHSRARFLALLLFLLFMVIAGVVLVV